MGGSVIILSWQKRDLSGRVNSRLMMSPVKNVLPGAEPINYITNQHCPEAHRYQIQGGLADAAAALGHVCDDDSGVFTADDDLRRGVLYRKSQ